MKAITTKYVGPGNVRGARIIADDGDGNRLIVPYDHASSTPHDDAAIALCRRMAWTGTLTRGTLMRGGREVGNVYVWSRGGTLEIHQ